MTKASIDLQDLRRRMYDKAKADSAGTGGVGTGCEAQPESAAGPIGHMTLDVKPTGKPSPG